jgi:hypothetical protein
VIALAAVCSNAQLAAVTSSFVGQLKSACFTGGQEGVDGYPSGHGRS